MKHTVVKFQVPIPNTSWDMNYFPLLFSPEFRSSPDYRQTDRQTDRKRCIWAHRATCTGGLNKKCCSNQRYITRDLELNLLEHFPLARLSNMISNMSALISVALFTCKISSTSASIMMVLKLQPKRGCPTRHRSNLRIQQQLHSNIYHSRSLIVGRPPWP